MWADLTIGDHSSDRKTSFFFFLIYDDQVDDYLFNAALQASLGTSSNQ